MRTKTLFLAAAALAAGLATSMAQSNVYSVNVVGYINVPLASGQNVLLSNPLDNGSNTIASIDNGVIPNKSSAQVWNGTKFVLLSKTGGSWSSNALISQGTGFFVKPNSACTLTFVGSTPVSNNYVLAGGVNALVGAILPMQGWLTNTVVLPNALNVGSLPNKSSVQGWNGTKFVLASRTSGTWSSNFNIGVAQGFFAKPNAVFTWKQWLQ